MLFQGFYRFILKPHATVVPLLSAKNGSSDEDFYTAGYSGTPVKFDRLSREKVQLYAPCLTLLWMLQPDKFYSLLGNHSIADSGLPQRFLICDTHAEPEEITDRKPVAQKVFTEWDSCIRGLLANYRFRETRQP